MHVMLASDFQSNHVGNRHIGSLASRTRDHVDHDDLGLCMLPEQPEDSSESPRRTLENDCGEQKSVSQWPTRYALFQCNPQCESKTFLIKGLLNFRKSKDSVQSSTSICSDTSTKTLLSTVNRWQRALQWPLNYQCFTPTRRSLWIRKSFDRRDSSKIKVSRRNWFLSESGRDRVPESHWRGQSCIW